MKGYIIPMARTANPSPVTITDRAEKAIRRRHPWIFSRGVKPPDIPLTPGQTVCLMSENKTKLGLGAYSPHSQIRIRMWSFNPLDTINEAFFHQRLTAAIEARNAMALPQPCNARRLVNAESDGLPGFIADQYDEYLVCQFLSVGAEYWKAVIVEQLRQLLPIKGIYERSDVDIRSKEGLPETQGLLWGSPPPPLTEIQLGRIRMLADNYKGHKTGFYLDQRENHTRIADYAEGADVLNCFSYSGAFGLWAWHAGARCVTNLDASQEALALAEKNLALNGAEAELVHANVFDQLRRYRDTRRQFDTIILDPPKFVASASQITKGSRGYKDINLLALKLLKPGGILMTFSCSGLVPPALFQKIIADAALDAHRPARFIQILHQAADHPVATAFPEGHYLKGLICLVE